MAAELTDEDHVCIDEWGNNPVDGIMANLPELENVHPIKAGPEGQAILKRAKL